MPISAFGLREKSKARRRSEIVATAASLWRKQTIETVGLQRIAREAEVAPQTIHNLIGTHEAVVTAVIDQLLDRLNAALETLGEADGVERSIKAVRISAEMFVADPALYRQIVIRIPAAMFLGSRTRRNSLSIQVDAVLTAQKQRHISRTADATRIGQNIFFGYMGALYAWASGAIGNAAFLKAAEFVALSALLPFATPAKQKTLAKRLLKLSGRKPEPAIRPPAGTSSRPARARSKQESARVRLRDERDAG